MTHSLIVSGYAACACAWTFIESRILLERMESDRKHPVNKAIAWVRKRTDHRNVVERTALKLLACLLMCVTTLAACMASGAAWVVTMPVYVCVNLWEHFRGRR